MRWGRLRREEEFEAVGKDRGGRAYLFEVRAD